MKILIIIFLVVFSHCIYAEIAHIPIEIINKFFNKNKVNRKNERIPFSQKELENIFSSIQPVSKSVAREITKKYLNICYPKG